MQTNYYLGVVVAVDNHELLKKDKESREIIVDIPGVMENILAHPKSCELDEPKVGDPVILENLDPVYNSYFTYYKLKENNFIGIRAAGKMISITPLEITIGVFDKDAEYKDGEQPEYKSYIVIDSDGNVEINSKGNVGINAEGNVEVNANGNDVAVSNATLKTNGGVTKVGTSPSGGFCGIPTCPFTGAVHTTNSISNIK